MTNLTELITQWIGEEIPTEYKNLQFHDICSGYNYALQDLKSKIPDLIEKIEKEYEGRLEAMYEQGKADIFMTKQL